MRAKENLPQNSPKNFPQNLLGYVPALASGLAVVSVLFVLLGVMFVILFGYIPSRTKATDAEGPGYYSSERQEIPGLPPFTKIAVEVGEVSVQHGAQPAVFVENARYLDRLSVDGGGTLLLRSRVPVRRRDANKERERVQIILPELAQIKAEDDAIVKVGPGFSGKKIDISVFGVASVKLEQAEFGTMQLNLNGSVSFQADVSRFEFLDVDMAGASHADVVNLAPQARLRLDNLGTSTFTLQTEGEGSIGETSVRINGGGNVTLRDFATGASLSVKLSGIGSLRYGGAPNIVESNISGIGSLEALD